MVIDGAHAGVVLTRPRYSLIYSEVSDGDRRTHPGVLFCEDVGRLRVFSSLQERRCGLCAFKKAKGSLQIRVFKSLDKDLLVATAKGALHNLNI